MPNEPEASNKLNDVEGFYLPRTRINLGTLDRDSIIAFSLDQPAVIVKADFTGKSQVTHCSERVATPDTLHLLCIDRVLGTITVDGHFLAPRVADGVVPKAIDDDLVDATVTVTRGTRVRYSQRHRFFWGWGE